MHVIPRANAREYAEEWEARIEAEEAAEAEAAAAAASATQNDHWSDEEEDSVVPVKARPSQSMKTKTSPAHISTKKTKSRQGAYEDADTTDDDKPLIQWARPPKAKAKIIKALREKKPRAKSTKSKITTGTSDENGSTALAPATSVKESIMSRKRKSPKLEDANELLAKPKRAKATRTLESQNGDKPKSKSKPAQTTQYVSFTACMSHRFLSFVAGASLTRRTVCPQVAVRNLALGLNPKSQRRLHVHQRRRPHRP